MSNPLPKSNIDLPATDVAGNALDWRNLTLWPGCSNTACPCHPDNDAYPEAVCWSYACHERFGTHKGQWTELRPRLGNLTRLYDTPLSNVLVNWQGDFFDHAAPTEWRKAATDIMAQVPDQTYWFLTKWPEVARQQVWDLPGHGRSWVGTSVGATRGTALYTLLQMWAVDMRTALHRPFLSIEPLLHEPDGDWDFANHAHELGYGSTWERHPLVDLIFLGPLNAPGAKHYYERTDFDVGSEIQRITEAAVEAGVAVCHKQACRRYLPEGYELLRQIPEVAL